MTIFERLNILLLFSIALPKRQHLNYSIRVQYPCITETNLSPLPGLQQNLDAGELLLQSFTQTAPQIRPARCGNVCTGFPDDAASPEQRAPGALRPSTADSITQSDIDEAGRQNLYCVVATRGALARQLVWSPPRRTARHARGGAARCPLPD